ncbi:MAG: helix-turn-helix transcriptional regulator [bacterium]
MKSLFSKWLIRYRINDLKLTQEELAQRLEIDHNSISRYENGKSTPSFKVLRALSEISKIEIVYFHEMLKKELHNCKRCSDEVETLYGFSLCKDCWEDRYGESLNELEGDI